MASAADGGAGAQTPRDGVDLPWWTDWAHQLPPSGRTEALAALGLLTTDAPPAGSLDNERTVQGTRLVWRLPPPHGDRPRAPRLAAQWRDWISTHGPIAVLVGLEETLSEAGRWDVAHLLRTLPGVVGTAVEAGAGWPVELDWPLPCTIGLLPGDAAWPALTPAAALARTRQPWPFRYQTVSRRRERQEVLASSLDLPTLIGRLTDQPLKLRSHLVIVNGWGTTRADSRAADVRALAVCLSASGVAVLRDGLAPDRFAEHLNAFAHELSHDWSLDAALQHEQAFGPDLLLVATRALLRAARAGTQVKNLGERLRSLPAGTSITMNEDALPRALPRIELSRSGGGFWAGITADAAADAMATAGSELSFDRESEAASVLAQLTDAIRRGSAERATDTGAARYIQQQSFCRATPHANWVRVEDGYVLGEPTRLRVRIGGLADAAWQSSDGPFPMEKLPPNQAQHHLSVVFHEPRQFDQPLPLVRVVLPRIGPSTEAEFSFTPRIEGAFEGRIGVLHRGRVLQTALLRTRVRASRDAQRTDDDRFVLIDETRVRHDWSSLDQRQRFDLALVCNHDARHVAGMTAVDERHAWAADLDGIQETVADINGLLSGVAQNVKDHGDGLDQGDNPSLLAALAFAGAQLYQRLVRDQLERTASPGFAVGQLEYIQIVGTRIDAVVPIEFVYDRPLSALRDDLSPCPGYREALKTGQCGKDCPGSQEPDQHVCPLGFWGVSKVIERHVFDAVAALGAPLVVRAETNSARPRLNVVESGAVLGHSDRVSSKALDTLRQLLRPCMPVYDAVNWKEWSETIGLHAPAWLIAFPHNEGSGSMRRLEIGKVMLRTTALAVAGDGAPSYVRRADGGTPLVFLLGCDTAGSAQQYGSHVAAFRDAGAAVVVSTIASVFGEHAVAVGTAIARSVLLHLNATNAGSGENGLHLGEILREAKRAALLESLPMALCVVAFGDADWSL